MTVLSFRLRGFPARYGKKKRNKKKRLFLFIFALLAGEVKRCNQLPVHAASKVCSLIICNINTLHECSGGRHQNCSSESMLLCQRAMSQ